jgi:hypothetical protein
VLLRRRGGHGGCGGQTDIGARPLEEDASVDDAVGQDPVGGGRDRSRRRLKEGRDCQFAGESWRQEEECAPRFASEPQRPAGMPWPRERGGVEGRRRRR